jgi:hypothetical protein
MLAPGRVANKGLHTMRSKAIKIKDGSLRQGATPWQNLPGHVRHRVTSENPWAPKTTTPQDKMVQDVYAGYFTVMGPDEQWEIWVSSPEPGLRNGISFVKTVQYRDEPFAPVDHRAVLLLQKSAARNRHNVDAVKRHLEEIQKSLADNKEAKARFFRDALYEEFMPLYTNERYQGKILRPVRPVTVPDQLVTP